MTDRSDPRPVSRRRFLQGLGMAAVAGRAFLESGDARAAVYAARDAAGEEADWPEMTHRRLGRTGFDAGRLVMGCGATLMFRRKDALLNAAYDAGINVFDVGFGGYYRNAEKNLAPFLQKVRDSVFLISKAPADLDIGPNEAVTPAQAREAAKVWSERMDQSLAALRVDHVDAYYLMASYNPSLIRSDEVYEAFEKAKQAGKVKHLGLSTHRNAEKVLLAAAETGHYDVAMIAITPGGWYDWESKSVLEGSPPMTDLRSVLDKARAAGIGLVGMKASRYLAGLPFIGWGDQPDAFDRYYDESLRAAPLSTFQRSYAYVLAHGLDVVNADMGNLSQLQENVVAATTLQNAFA
ncbi:MAG: aldo/keto reductase [Deltaproteobacteria bacterium]|nr:aldo/keto reductase [Deltaproteobacteria bacterium]